MDCLGFIRGRTNGVAKIKIDTSKSPISCGEQKTANSEDGSLWQLLRAHQMCVLSSSTPVHPLQRRPSEEMSISS